MGTLFMAVPKASHAVVEVATSAVVKTVLQVAVPAATDIRVHGWGISFKGIVGTEEPGNVVLGAFDVAATGLTSVTPEEWENEDGPVSLCVGGATATGYNATGEGTLGASFFLDSQGVHPQSGYGVYFPEGRRPRVKNGRFLRVRTTFDVTVACIPWILFEEPA